MALRLQPSPGVASLLAQASVDPTLSQDLRESAKELGAAKELEWPALRRVLHVFRGKDSQDGVLHQALMGSRLVLQAPPPRTKSPELLARLAVLQKQADQREYDRMVHDVTQTEREAEALREGGLVSYRQQLSFGAHVLVMMGTFYALGHAGAVALDAAPAMRAVAGLIGLVAALLLEVVLLIVRSAEVPKSLQRDAERRRRVARQRADDVATKKAS